MNDLPGLGLYLWNASATSLPALEISETLSWSIVKIQNIIHHKNEKFFDESLKETDIGQDKLVEVLNWSH